MLKTVIYARYSSDKQNEQSIEGQIHECEQFAKTHDMVIIKHYIDRALSGKTDDRPSFLQMIKDSSSGLFDAILVYKTDRFARNRYDSAVYKAKLKKNGIKIFYAKENIPDGPEGIILESMLEGFAEYYSAELSQKVKRGIKENIRKGLSFGGACPFGYKIVNKKYVIDDEQAPYVKKIFEDYAKGRRAIDIFNELNTLPNYAGKGRKWNRSSLNRMLTNKKYIGIYELEDVCVKDAIPPIIDEALFNKVQSRILFNRRHTTRAKVNYLLSGKLFCGLCEHSMTGKTGTSKTKVKYHYYVCSNRHCKQKKYRKELLEDIIIQYTVKDILNPKHFKMIAKKCLEIQQADNKINDILLMLKKQLTATKTKINNIMNAIEAGIITTSTKDRLEQLEQEKYKLELEISTQQLNSNRLLSEKQIIYMLNVFYNKRVDVSFYNQIIDCFIYKIYIYSDKICIVYNLNNSDKDVTYSDINELYKSSHLNSCGSPLGEENVKALRDNLGWEEQEAFVIPQDVYDNFAQKAKKGQEVEDNWNKLFKAYCEKYPEKKALWDKYFAVIDDEKLLNCDEFWSYEDKPQATRSLSGNMINRLAKIMPNFWGGSADLGPSNKTVIKDGGSFSKNNYLGRNIHYGVREFAMAAIANGITLYGGTKTFVGTFFVFSDYLKPMARLAALMKIPVTYVLTHDSIGVGEDGPTHEPIEQLAMLRAMPNINVFRPADATETAAAWYSAITSKNTPTVLALSRQNLPQIEGSSKEALKGGYIIAESIKAKPDAIIIASGSEVSLAVDAKKELMEKGFDIRVVSMPCMDIFEQQSDEYKEKILPQTVEKRLVVEAGSSICWGKYLGFKGKSVTIDTFGASAPANVLFKKYGFTVENVVNKALSMLK